jgi:hypothetical protein
MIARRHFANMVFGYTALVALGGCRAGETPSYRYKLAIEVQTPEGPRSAYSVIGVQFYGAMKGFEALSGGSVKARGQAIALDLPNGKTLFVLLRSNTSADWAGNALRRQHPKKLSDFSSAVNYSNALVSDKSIFPVRRWQEMPDGSKRDDYPLLVTFNNIKDPASVKQVDPDDLEASFGAGYKLNAMTVQVTDEPVTVGIEKRLKWLNSPSVMRNPGWRKLPLETRTAINGLQSGSAVTVH